MNKLVAAVAVSMLLAVACQPAPEPASLSETEPTPVLLLNVTADPLEDPHSVTMALQLAGHGLDDGRDVVLFLNVRAVPVATTDLPGDLSFHAEPIEALLTDLVSRGAEVHVCPHCMKALGIPESALIDGAQVTSREALFARLTPETNVFTY